MGLSRYSATRPPFVVTSITDVTKWGRDGEWAGKPDTDPWDHWFPYQPFPKQKQFHRAAAKYRLYGGAAGPGKSMALLMEAVLQANRYDGVNTLLLRRTFPELEDSLVSAFHRHVPREFYWSFNESKHTVLWHNGSTTRFGHCHNESDVYQYQGAEFLFIGIDELTHFTLKEWQFLTSRNRCPVPGTYPNMAGATNPGNIGHAWVKALWIDRKPAPGMDSAGGYDPANYRFIAAKLADNPIYANDKNYLASLRALPDADRKRFLEGNWDELAGQFFDSFDPSRHTERLERLGLQPWMPRWISIDWGFEHSAAVYWHAQDGKKTYTYREWVVQHLSPRALAQEIAHKSASEKIDAVYLGPDAFARRTDEATIADQLGNVFAERGLPRPAPADNDRVGGWMLLYDLLAHGEWIIADNCRKLIEVLPTLVRDDRTGEDILKVEGDDPADAARYGLKTRFKPRTPPVEQRVAQRMEQVRAQEPTVRAIYARGIESEERKRQRPVTLRRRRQ
jgi:hypothetical protein